MKNRHVSLGSIEVLVREPDPYLDRDLFYDDFYEEIKTAKDGPTVYAVVEFGSAGTAYYTEGYVDWYGDGGTAPSEVVTELLFRAIVKSSQA